MIFLAPDNARLTDLRKAVAEHIVWSGIVDAKESLNLDVQQLRQATSRAEDASRTMQARLRETWSWLLSPWTEPEPGSPVQWEARQLRAGGEDEALSVAAGKRALSEEFVIQSYAGSMLRRQIDLLPSYREGWNHVRLRDLTNWFSNYLYLPRLQNPGVLEKAVADGLRAMMWEMETFAYADLWDEEAERYRGLAVSQPHEVSVNMLGSAVLVHPEVARKQFDEDELKRAERETDREYTENGSPGGVAEAGAEVGFSDALGSSVSDSAESAATNPRRYFGSVVLNPNTLASQVSEISRELVSHLSSVYGSEVKISLEIEAVVPDGVPEETRRKVIDRAKDLRFEQSDFAED